jgi:hypothetical protein
MKLAVAFVVLLFASVARADDGGISAGECSLIIPDGSTVTATSIFPDPQGPGSICSVNFSFADGTGEVEGSVYEGEGGSLFFTVPVSDVSFDWGGYLFNATDNVGDGLFGNNPFAGSEGTGSFAGTGITEIDYSSPVYNDGIHSISYVAPEPSSLLLLGIGLAALIGLTRRGRIRVQATIQS